MVLTVTTPCVQSPITISLCLNLILSVYFSTRVPVPNNDKKRNFSCIWDLVPERSLNQPPYFFYEVRLGFLYVSLIYSFGHLIFVALRQDVAVVLQIFRCVCVLLQIRDQRWLCLNWEGFFILRQKQAYVWCRFLMMGCVFFWSLFIQKMVHYELSQWAEILVHFLIGGTFLTGYFWAKGWKFTWGGDVMDERRIPCIKYISLVVCLWYVMITAYVLATEAISTATGYIGGGVVFLCCYLVLRSTQGRESKFAENFAEHYSSV